VWAKAKTRAAIWDALWARRTVALTGDRIALQLAVDGCPMGSTVAAAERRQIAFHVVGGAAIDCVDIVKNGALLRRFSRCDVPHDTDPDVIRTKLFLEVGWGERQVRADWEVRFGISDGRILAVEPRFRGKEVVSPTDLEPANSEQDPRSPLPYHTAHWEPDGSLDIRFRATTYGNPNNSTPVTQGVCLDVEMPRRALVRAVINGRKVDIPLAQLLEGARTGRMGKHASPCYRFHRAPRRWEFDWRGEFEDRTETAEQSDIYYARVRQMNDQWAWGSPVRVSP
jgi:hypothetical protein